MRAIAIWLVLVYHVTFPIEQPALAGVPSAFKAVFAHGWLGVDLFFVLSGFLITGILLNAKGRPNYAKNFYVRRALRIFPLYFAVIIVLASVYAHALPYAVLASVFMANFHSLFHVHEPLGLSILWSLNIEEHFYLLWPWLVLWCRRQTLMYWALAILCLTPVARGMAFAHGVNPFSIYAFSFYRFDGLALGALLAIFCKSNLYNKKNGLRGAIALLAASVTITLGGIPFGILHEGIARSALRYTEAQLVFASLILFAITTSGSEWTAILRSRVFTYTGDLSYCLYLIHVAVLGFCTWATASLFSHYQLNLSPKAGFYVIATATVALCYAIATMSKRFLEDPFLRLKRFFQ